MDANRLRGLMGLCVRAGQAAFGEDGCLKSVRGGQCGLLLVDAEASAGTMKKYRDACRSAGAELRVLPPGVIRDATGRPGMAMAVRAGGLADQLAGMFPPEATEDQYHCGGASAE